MLVRVSSPCTLLALGLVALSAAPALAQVENGDLRIRADFRLQDSAAWGAGNSVGHAEFRIVSRFMQVYYGGVLRADEYRFTTQIDFTELDDFSTLFAASSYNTNYDVYINDGFVGRVIMNNSGPGIGELQYDSRHPSPPATLIPANFPDPVNVGDSVSVYAAAPALPAIGDPRPATPAFLQSELVEEFARGDANQDGNVDSDDYSILAANYDPYHRSSNHIGPANGDFTGDNLSDNADYVLFVANWTESQTPPAEPTAVLPPCPADVDDGASTGTPDGGVTIDDLLYYINQFSLGLPAADLDNGTGLGIKDNGVTIDDLLYYLQHFAAGC
ncbi:MAG: GC-type dockerin domain-anchored protein [Phycisphaerales bacterium]